MSPLRPDVSPENTAAAPDPARAAGGRDETCRVKNVIPTGAIFAAAVERLNREASLAMLQELAAEIDRHCQRLDGGSPAEAAALRGDLLSRLAPLLDAVGAKLDENLGSALARELKPIEARLGQLESQGPARRRPLRSAGAVAVALLVAVLCFIIGLLLGRRYLITPVAVPPAPPVATAAAACCQPCTAEPARAPSQAAAGVTAVAAPADGSAALREPAAPPKPARGANWICLSGIEARRGSMEAELATFLDSAAGTTPRSFIMDRLRYPADSHEMNPEGKEQVYLLAKILLAHPSAQLEIRGRVDGIESEEYSGPGAKPGYPLSLLRADCVLRRLINMGVAADRMKIVGLGAADPAPAVDGEPQEETRQRNRRVELVFTKR